ncbi:MAG: cobalamin B12-binding domain-containing protein [Thermoproteota archaeon]|jgi:methylmalonyl-CoA mutase C-terminal domain/subunit|nr:cobalamin B12-binding domain-containing protein [Thermoproteota archaeon]
MELGRNLQYFREIVSKLPKRIKILVAKPGLDAHDRGVHVLMRYFRDAGLEVVYSGILATVDEIVQTAIDEDVDVIALSSMNGAHMVHFPAVVEKLRERGASDIIVVGGGIIPEDDKPKLEAIGVTGNYGPGTPLEVILAHILNRVIKEKFKLDIKV